MESGEIRVGMQVYYASPTDTNYDEEVRYLEVGTVVSEPDCNGSLGVDWERETEVRHNCGGDAREHHGWYVDARDLEEYDDFIQIGDRVMVTQECDEGVAPGDLGTVLGIRSSVCAIRYKIRMDKYNSFLGDCGGDCEEGYGLSIRVTEDSPVKIIKVKDTLFNPFEESEMLAYLGVVCS